MKALCTYWLAAGALLDLRRDGAACIGSESRQEELLRLRIFLVVLDLFFVVGWKLEHHFFWCGRLAIRLLGRFARCFSGSAGAYVEETRGTCSSIAYFAFQLTKLNV